MSLYYLQEFSTSNLYSKGTKQNTWYANVKFELLIWNCLLCCTLGFFMISGFLLVDEWEEPYALGVIPILKTICCLKNAWLMYNSLSLDIFLCYSFFFVFTSFVQGLLWEGCVGFVALRFFCVCVTFISLCLSPFVYLTVHSAVPVSVRLIFLKSFLQNIMSNISFSLIIPKRVLLFSYRSHQFSSFYFCLFETKVLKY